MNYKIELKSMTSRSELKRIVEGILCGYESILLESVDYYDRKTGHEELIQYARENIALQLFFLEENFGLKTFEYPIEDINKELCLEIAEFIEEYTYEKRGITG